MPRDSASRATVKMLVRSQNALDQGGLQAALTLVDSAVARAPRLPDAHFQRGRVLAELRRFKESNAAYRRVLELDPDYQGARYNLGNNAYRQQKYQKAVRLYRKGLRRHASARTLVAQGRAYTAQEKIDSARAAYERALDLDSTHALAHARLGQLLADQGSTKAALRHSKRALDLKPDNAKFRYAVGRQLLQAGRPGDAVEHLKTAVEERPWHQGAHYNLGQALLRLDRSDEAQRYLAAADSLEQVQSRIERLRSQAQSAPSEVKRWRTLGQALKGAGRLQEAQEAYSVALYLRPKNPVLRNELAKIASDRGRYEAAISQYRTLLRQHPSYVRGWFNLGVVHARNGHPKRARKAWKRVLKHDPSHQQARKYLASLNAN
ncbi:MAG: tetratricopeptide repeat protein [Salinibacter sp.]